MSRWNKLQKIYRKETRLRMKEEFNLLKQITRPRPRFVPRWLWRAGLAIFIKKDASLDV